VTGILRWWAVEMGCRCGVGEKGGFVRHTLVGGAEPDARFDTRKHRQ
jgi:hypothetical protein